MELLIVGGGLAAQRCIEVLRAAGDDRPITVVCDEPVRPYDRPPLSKEGLHDPVDTAFRPAGWYADHDVGLRVGAAARSLDPAQVKKHGSELAEALGEAVEKAKKSAEQSGKSGWRFGAELKGDGAGGVSGSLTLTWTW